MDQHIGGKNSKKRQAERYGMSTLSQNGHPHRDQTDEVPICIELPMIQRCIHQQINKIWQIVSFFLVIFLLLQLPFFRVFSVLLQCNHFGSQCLHAVADMLKSRVIALQPCEEAQPRHKIAYHEGTYDFKKTRHHEFELSLLLLFLHSRVEVPGKKTSTT